MEHDDSISVAMVEACQCMAGKERGSLQDLHDTGAASCGRDPEGSQEDALWIQVCGSTAPFAHSVETPSWMPRDHAVKTCHHHCVFSPPNAKVPVGDGFKDLALHFACP